MPCVALSTAYSRFWRKRTSCLEMENLEIAECGKASGRIYRAESASSRNFVLTFYPDLSHYYAMLGEIRTQSPLTRAAARHTSPRKGRFSVRRSAPSVPAILCGLVLAGLAGPATQSSMAALFTLTDDNSVVQFDTATQANAFNWFVDGVDQLAQQAFWYRIGNSGPES